MNGWICEYEWLHVSVFARFGVFGRGSQYYLCLGSHSSLAAGSHDLQFYVPSLSFDVAHSSFSFPLFASSLSPSPSPHPTQATNIAETSVTINGVRVVVDAGLVKKRVHLARSGMDCLTTMGMPVMGVFEMEIMARIYVHAQNIGVMAVSGIATVFFIFRYFLLYFAPIILRASHIAS